MPLLDWLHPVMNVTVGATQSDGSELGPVAATADAQGAFEVEITPTVAGTLIVDAEASIAGDPRGYTDAQVEVTARRRA